jgi:hypothetical protein
VQTLGALQVTCVTQVQDLQLRAALAQGQHACRPQRLAAAQVQPDQRRQRLQLVQGELREGVGAQRAIGVAQLQARQPREAGVQPERRQPQVIHAQADALHAAVDERARRDARAAQARGARGADELEHGQLQLGAQLLEQLPRRLGGRGSRWLRHRRE